MRFSNAFLDELRDRVPISDLIGRRVTWDMRKTNVARGDYWGCCPFHNERSPSFHCEERKGRFHCFGCGMSGDHFKFLIELEGLSFPEAVQQIADMGGITLPAADPAAEKREKERTSLLDVMELATRFFEERLLSADGAKARAYLQGRGLTERTIETFRLGFAPDSRNALKEFLASRGISKEQIEACGLVVHGPDIAVSYDRFRDRIMFPILSPREKVIAFGGRAMSPDASAKYLNSNDTELFHKGDVLYNLARARLASASGRGNGGVVAVEGYIDVIALHQAGVLNAVAPLGTALTANQLELLWKMDPAPILCFDGDGAGIRAANRAADLALPSIKPGRSVRFALLPDGKDPDDLVRAEGRSAFDSVTQQARALSEVIWIREIGEARFDTPESRAELEARLKQLVSTIADEGVRRHYQQDMRERLNRLFQPQFQRRASDRRDMGRGGSSQGGRGAGWPQGGAISDRLARSGLVKGDQEMPTLRESALALTVINHPSLMQDEHEEIFSIDFDNRALRRLWPELLAVVSTARHPTREQIVEHIAGQGFGPLLQKIEQQIRNARLWTATAEAAVEDAREGFRQALAFHKRTKALRRERIDIERRIAEATEAGDSETMEKMMRALQEIQLEATRLEHQEAMIDGFGVLSGRVKGAATH
jgi:DNA primase